MVGRQAGSADGYKFKKDILAAGESGLVWDETTLDDYLVNPTQFLRTYLDNPKARSAMSFKLTNEQDRRDVILYLAAVPEGGGEPSAAAPAVEPEVDVDAVVEAQTFSDEFLANAENVAVGKEIWFAQCAHCHGFKAYPGKAPKLKPGDYSPEFVFKRVYKGFRKMPAWRDSYSVEEIRQIVAYVKAKSFAP